MSEPVRVLHVFGKMDLGGAESRIMDLYRHMDREKIQFDFMVHSPDRGFYEDEIESMGGRIFRVPRFRIYNYSAYRNAFTKFFDEHKEFTVVQGHMTSTASIYLPIAKKAGVRTTVAHARSAGVDAGLKGIATRVLRKDLKDKADFLFGCSKEASISVFGKSAYESNRTVFIPNAIECDKFKYNPIVRSKLRKELGLDGRFVIGHVGRFHPAKNHEYLIRTFMTIRIAFKSHSAGIKEGYPEDLDDPVLLLFGEGPLMKNISELSKAYGISDSIVFMGNKSNIWDYYNVMDFFMYPSVYEGMPGTVLEAQANGLMTLMSDSISDDVCITDLVKKETIKSHPSVWTDTFLFLCTYEPDNVFDDDARYHNSINSIEALKGAGYDVGTQAERMTKFYIDGVI